MSSQNKRMGTDPLAWINQESEQTETTKTPKIGRPRTIRREYEKSSQENLPENWTRATFIVREDRLKRLKDYAYNDRRSLKDIVNEMIEEYLDQKEFEVE